MKKILMIATGGTIASKEGAGGLTPAMTGEELASFVPGIEDKCELDILQLMNIDSTNMRPRQWMEIRDAVMEHYGSYDGFVILHGTDTMAYTAAALSYLIQNTPKPIVITGSQKPMGNPYTDAKLNVYQSILYALDDGSCNVSIVFNGKAVAGTRGRKQRTRSFDAFESMNFPLLAVIHDDRIVRKYAGTLPTEGDLVTYTRLNDRVFVLKLTPEVKADLFGLLDGGYDAIILETFGIGGIPEYDDSFEKAIFGWVDSGKALAVTTQVPEEGCDLDVYQVGKKYSEHPGILQAGDMTTEAIVAKMMWILGQTHDRDEIRRLFFKEINHDRTV
ncbi:asparaginase [Extibacter muris]|uniref:asparaginase n=1 Tax=Extibacter muris TaxID=1796622 RepID=A0A4R4FID8_9FIRM|nr:asparaginase [Extibacter muris]MCU0079213.1 asparaginase [Extibacter muris]TDA23497.1 asparaginase [Extibacter muris]